MVDYPALIRTMVAALAPDFCPGQLAQGRQDSNLQPAVLETAALPIAPLPYGVNATLLTKPPACTGAHVIIRVFNTGEPVYATTSRS
jgi:hypothetical protein